APLPGALVGAEHADQVDQETGHEDRPVAEARREKPGEPRQDPAVVHLAETGDQHRQHGGQTRVRSAQPPTPAPATTATLASVGPLVQGIRISIGHADRQSNPRTTPAEGRATPPGAWMQRRRCAPAARTLHPAERSDLWVRITSLWDPPSARPRS